MQILTILLLLWSFQSTSDSELSRNAENEDINRIALSLSGESPFTLTQEHIDISRKIGINLLETDQPEELNQLNVDAFYLLLTVDQKYITPVRLAANWREFATNTIQSYLLSQTIFPERVVAINLFQYPDDRSESFFEYSTLIADTLRNVTDLPLYYQTHRGSSTDVYNPYRFKSVIYRHKLPELNSSGNVIYFKPSDHPAESILSLESLFSAVNETTEPVIIIPAEWFFHLLESTPDMELVFSSFIRGEILSFPLPEVPETLPNLNLSVLLLLIIWSGVIIIYKFRPGFFDKCVRFFLSHKFFVQDVNQNRNRNLADGLYLLALHLLISTLFFYTLSLILFDTTGLKVFSSHFYVLFLENYESYSFLIFGFAVAALLHTISIFWLYLFNNNFKRVSQIVNLYSWGFILNLLLVTVLVFSYLFGWSTGWAMILTLCYFLVWFFSFNIAAVNSARFMDSFKVPYVLLTIGLHMALIIVLITYLMIETQLLESLSLAHWLSK